MTCLRHETKVAKRNHKRRCELTSVPIEVGDRYMSIAGVWDGDFSAYKCHPIINQICIDQDHYNEGFLLSEAIEYLKSWLESHLGDCSRYPEEPNETRQCLEAAIQYWNSFRKPSH